MERSAENKHAYQKISLKISTDWTKLSKIKELCDSNSTILLAFATYISLRTKANVRLQTIKRDNNRF